MVKSVEKQVMVYEILLRTDWPGKIWRDSDKSNFMQKQGSWLQQMGCWLIARL